MCAYWENYTSNAKGWHELNILTIGILHIILHMYTKLKIHYQIFSNVLFGKTIRSNIE